MKFAFQTVHLRSNILPLSYSSSKQEMENLRLYNICHKKNQQIKIPPIAEVGDQGFEAGGGVVGVRTQLDLASY